jgi:hypothetical protein
MGWGRRLAAAVVCGMACSGGVAVAHESHVEFASDGAIEPGIVQRQAKQHGTETGHLPGSSSKVDLISRLRLKNVVPEKIADVGVSADGNYAFLAAWGITTCRYNGVHVVNIADPAKPREVAFIQAKEGSYPGEGIQALPLTTSAFRGEIVVSNNEICKDKAGFGGLNIYDVSNPGHPVPLAEGIGDSTANGQGKKTANEIHSVFAWDAGSKGYAVIVDNEEDPDVDIVDITDPRKPKLIAEHDLDELFPQIKQAAPPNLNEIFHHDVIVKEIGGHFVMLVSYWDAGYVKLNVDDPRNPVYLGDSDFKNPDPEAAESGHTVPPEGNGHQSEFTSDNAYAVASDEDFNPYALLARNVTDGTGISASQGDGTRQLTPGQTITGPSIFVGRACPGDPAVPPGGPGVQIAVVERGLCTFTEKITSVVGAGGYEAVLVFNRTASDGCENPLGMLVEGDIPAFGVAPRSQGFAIFDIPYDEAACLAGDGTQQAPIPIGTMGDTLTFSSYFDGWGYVHLFRNNNGKMTELDTYAIPQAHDPAYAQGFGDLSVHEVATSHENSRRLYFSYYTGGLRVAKITAREKIQEVGHYIDGGGNNFWGVQVFRDAGKEYVAASDRDHGLWIFRYAP